MQKVERKFEKFPKNGRANLKGDSCEYIDLAKITGVEGCETGKDKLKLHATFSLF